MFPSDRALLLEDDVLNRSESAPLVSYTMTVTFGLKKKPTPKQLPPKPERRHTLYDDSLANLRKVARRTKSLMARGRDNVLAASAASIKLLGKAVKKLAGRGHPRSMEPAGGSTGSINAPAPHRGFNQKARDVLIGDDAFNLINVNGRGMPNKSASEFDLRRKLNSLNSRKKDSNGSSPKSQSSVSSIPENSTITFDTIGERPAAKKHLKLSDIGKTQSCAELKSDKRLLRTFQEDNIIKMPSMDSDIGSPMRSDMEQLCLSFEGIGKSMIYSQNGDNNSNEVKKKGKK